MPVRGTRISSKFEPLNDELLLKLAEAPSVEHKKMQESMEELGLASGAVEQIASTGKESSKMYKKFDDALKASAQALASNGLSGAVRSQAMQLKGLYGQNIQPIMAAEKNRQDQQKMYDAIVAQDPTWIGRNPHKSSIDEYLHGIPALGGVSGEKIRTMAMTSAAAESAERIIPYKPDGRGYLIGGLGYTDAEQKLIVSALANPNDANTQNALRNAIGEDRYAGVMQSYRTILEGLDYKGLNVEDPQSRAMIVQNALDGYYRGLTYKEDARKDLALEQALHRAQINAYRNAGNGDSNQETAPRSPYDNRDIRTASSATGSAVDKEIDAYIDRYNRDNNHKNKLSKDNMAHRRAAYKNIQGRFKASNYISEVLGVLDGQKYKLGNNVVYLTPNGERKKRQGITPSKNDYVTREQLFNMVKTEALKGNFSKSFGVFPSMRKKDGSEMGIDDVEKALRNYVKNYGNEYGEQFGSSFEDLIKNGDISHVEKEYIIADGNEAFPEYKNTFDLISNEMYGTNNRSVEVKSVDGKKKKRIGELFKISADANGNPKRTSNITEFSYTPLSLSQDGNEYIIATDVEGIKWKLPLKIFNSTMQEAVNGYMGLKRGSYNFKTNNDVYRYMNEHYADNVTSAGNIYSMSDNMYEALGPTIVKNYNLNRVGNQSGSMVFGLNNIDVPTYLQQLQQIDE